MSRLIYLQRSVAAGVVALACAGQAQAGRTCDEPQDLTPAKVEPRGQRPVELTAVILMLVGSNRGVSVLPDWVLREVRSNADYVTRPLAPGDVTKRLYAATRVEDATQPYMAHFLRLGRTEPVKLQRG